MVVLLVTYDGGGGVCIYKYMENTRIDKEALEANKTLAEKYPKLLLLLTPKRLKPSKSLSAVP